MVNRLYMIAVVVVAVSCVEKFTQVAAETDPAILLEALKNHTDFNKKLVSVVKSQDEALKVLLENFRAQGTIIKHQDELIKRFTDTLVAIDTRLKELEFAPFHHSSVTADGLTFYWSYDAFNSVDHAQAACAQIGGKLAEQSFHKLHELLSKTMVGDHVADVSYFVGIYADKDDKLVYRSTGLPADSDWGELGSEGSCYGFMPGRKIMASTSCNVNQGGAKWNALCSVPVEANL